MTSVAPTPCGRYAPTPSGVLHLGNLRTALIAWLQSRLAGGRFILRLDDLDRLRTTDACTAQMLDDLHWLGLDWDVGPDTCAAQSVQSARVELYERAFETIQNKNLAFACACSRKDVASAALAPHAKNRAPIYPGTCRARRLDSEDAVSWRFRVADEDIAFDDELLGRVQKNLARDIGDFVIKRRDGVFAYHFACAVDDALMGVTDVVRGADLADSTAQQIALFDALGFARPKYWHAPLMLDARGMRFAKRDAAEGLAGIKKRGLGAADAVGMLAVSCGLIADALPLSAAELRDSLSLETFHRRLRAHQNGHASHS